MQGDLTVDAEVDALIASVKAHPLVKANGLFGLVHNASFYSQAAFEDVTLETFRSLNRLHMEAPFVLTQSLLTDVEQVAARWSPSSTRRGAGLGGISPLHGQQGRPSATHAQPRR